jgi:hypothetical protein
MSCYDHVSIYIHKTMSWEIAYLHLTIDSITSTNSSPGTTVSTVVSPISASLAIGTITSHVSSIATDTANDVGSEVTLLGAVVLAMSDLAT